MQDSLRPIHFSTAGWNVKFPEHGDQLLCVDQVAQMLSKSPRTIRYLASIVEIPAFKVGRTWRFWYSEILEYIENHRGENLLK